MTDVAVKGVSWKAIALWVVRILIALVFLAAAALKLSAQTKMVDEFGLVGLGTWFMYFTGIVEVIGALAVLTPPLSGLGALWLLGVDIGAFFAQVFRIHEDWVHTIVIGLILGLLAFAQRAQIKYRLGF